MDELRVRALFEAVTVESCLKLFHDYNVQVTPGVASGRTGEGMLYCGIVGFTAKGFRGSIVLSATSGPLEHSNPVKAASQRDWMAELANQLAGRMKNRMLPHNVDISVGIPVVPRVNTSSSRPAPSFVPWSSTPPAA